MIKYIKLGYTFYEVIVDEKELHKGKFINFISNYQLFIININLSKIYIKFGA